MIRINKYRPTGFTGKGDRLLPQIAKDLSELIIETEESLECRDIYLTNEEWEFIAEILVEFAEDMHNEIGIWDSYERYNLELFGTPMPLTYDPEEELEPGTIDAQRICHILWMFYQEMYPGVLLSPYNHDIHEIAEFAADFLKERFENVPCSSGVKQYLIQSNDHGWDVKLKLVWFGMHSYMFRLPYSNFMLEKRDFSILQNKNIKLLNIIDEFICEGTTCWSGLGAIDILAGVLDITPEQQDELRGWYERHYGFFKVLSVKDNYLEMHNLINNEPYKVKVGKKELRFYKPGMRVWGYLLRWNNEWIWSGRQSTYSNLSKEENEKMILDFILEFPDIDTLYYKEKMKIAREKLKTLYKGFTKYFGDDLKVFPDGESLVESMNKFFEEYNSVYKEKLSGDGGIDEENNKSWHNYPFIEYVLEKNKPTGIYFNPEEGYEIFEGFHDLINGFKKKGIDLTKRENDTIYDFIVKNNVSPGFVKKLANDYGYESILSVFFIQDIYEYDPLEYLLHRYKGHYYRNRYPQEGVV